MNAIYNEYMNDFEREAEIMLATSTAQMKKINLLFEAVDATLEANMLSAEAKVLTENGTYDDLVMLYTEANAEAGKAKEGILQKLINFVSTLFTNIGNLIGRIFGKNIEAKAASLPENMKMDSETNKNMNFITKAWNFIKEPFEKIANKEQIDLEELKDAYKKATAEVAITATTTAAATAMLIPVSRQKIIDLVTLVVNKIQPMVNKWMGILKATKFGSAVVNLISKNKNTNDANNSTDKKNGSDNTETKDTNPADNQPNTNDTPTKKDGNWFMDACSWALNKLGEIGKKMNQFLKWVAGQFNTTKKKLVAKFKNNGKNTPAETTTADDNPAEDDAEVEEVTDDSSDGNNQNQTNESTSLFDMDLDSDFFTESEMSEDELNELSDLFAEL